jgi:predicted transcriptional regulator
MTRGLAMTDDATAPNTIELATKLTIAWLSNPNTSASAEEVPAFLKSMHAVVGDLAAPAETPGEEAQTVASEHVPAVSMRKSLASRITSSR